jgi:hypothetical protein
MSALAGQAQTVQPQQSWQMSQGWYQDFVTAAFRWNSQIIAELNAKAGVLPTDYRVQVFGRVTDNTLENENVGHYYTLVGQEGASIRVASGSVVPIPNQWVILRGLVKVDPKTSKPYIQEVVHVNLEAKQIQNVITTQLGLKAFDALLKYAGDPGDPPSSDILYRNAYALGYYAGVNATIDPGPAPVPPPPPPPSPWYAQAWGIAVIAAAALLVALLFALLLVAVLRKPTQVQANAYAAPQPFPGVPPASQGQGAAAPAFPGAVPQAEETIVMPSGEVTQVLDPKTVVMSKGWLEVISGGRPAGTRITLPAPYAVIGRRTPGQSRGEKYIGLDLSAEKDPAVRNALSREQAKISYDSAAKAFRIENVAKSGSLVTVNGTDLGSGDAATLEEGATIQMAPYWEFKFHTK